MNRTPPTMLGSNGQGEVAAEKWHEALLRLSRRQDRDSTIPPDKQTLGTRYSAEFEESSAPIVWADEIDTERRRDFTLFWLMLVAIPFGLVVAMGLVALVK